MSLRLKKTKSDFGTGLRLALALGRSLGLLGFGVFGAWEELKIPHQSPRFIFFSSVKVCFYSKPPEFCKAHIYLQLALRLNYSSSAARFT